MQEIVLKNVKLRWPFLAKKNEGGEYASGKYQVDVYTYQVDILVQKDCH